MNSIASDRPESDSSCLSGKGDNKEERYIAGKLRSFTFAVTFFRKLIWEGRRRVYAIDGSRVFGKEI